MIPEEVQSWISVATVTSSDNGLSVRKAPAKLSVCSLCLWLWRWYIWDLCFNHNISHFPFHADHHEAAAGGRKFSFNFHCGLLVHLERLFKLYISPEAFDYCWKSIGLHKCSTRWTLIFPAHCGMIGRDQSSEIKMCQVLWPCIPNSFLFRKINAFSLLRIKSSNLNISKWWDDFLVVNWTTFGIN